MTQKTYMLYTPRCMACMKMQARTGFAVALLRKCNVADTLVVWVGLEIAAVCDVIEVFDTVLLHHVPGGQRITHLRAKNILPPRQHTA